MIKTNLISNGEIYRRVWMAESISTKQKQKGVDSTMRFASQEFFNHLKQEVLNGNDDRIYYELYDVIKQSVEGKIKFRIKSEDANDVCQEVVIAVYLRLPEFIEKSENMHEAQRQAWLNTIVSNKISDYFRKNKKNIDTLSMDAMCETEDSEYIPLEIVKNFSTPDSPESIVMTRELSSAMNDLLVSLFSINTAPEKLMGFVYAKLLLAQERDSGTSGRPAEAERRLRGISLYDIFDMMKRDFSHVMKGNFSDEIFLPLQKKLDSITSDGTAVGDKRFNMTVKQITDGTNRISKKKLVLFEEYEKQMKGDTHDNDKSCKL